MVVVLKRPEEFREVYRDGKLRFGRYVAVHALVCEGGEVKFGVSVSKKVGNAVVRNRVKRRIREVVISLSPRFSRGGAIVIGAKIRSRDASFWELREDLVRALKGLGYLK